MNFSADSLVSLPPLSLSLCECVFSPPHVSLIMSFTYSYKMIQSLDETCNYEN